MRRGGGGGGYDRDMRRNDGPPRSPDRRGFGGRDADRGGPRRDDRPPRRSSPEGDSWRVKRDKSPPPRDRDLRRDDPRGGPPPRYDDDRRPVGAQPSRPAGAGLEEEGWTKVKR